MRQCESVKNVAEIYGYRKFYIFLPLNLTMEIPGPNEIDNFWRRVASKTLERKPKAFKFNKGENNLSFLPSRCTFMEHSLGELKGQINDWRAALQDSTEGFHAVEFRDHYECHIDKWDPNKNLWKHLSEDSPGTLGLIFSAGAVVLGGIATWFFVKDAKNKKKKKESQEETED